MSSDLSEAGRALLKAPNYATISTPRKDGTILSAVIWMDLLDNGRILVATGADRAWPRNLARAGHATLVVIDGANPYAYVSVTGRLAETRYDDPAVADTHALSRKYTGADMPAEMLNDRRASFELELERVTEFPPAG